MNSLSWAFYALLFVSGAVVSCMGKGKEPYPGDEPCRSSRFFPTLSDPFLLPPPAQPLSTLPPSLVRGSLWVVGTDAVGEACEEARFEENAKVEARAGFSGISYRPDLPTGVLARRLLLMGNAFVEGYVSALTLETQGKAGYRSRKPYEERCVVPDLGALLPLGGTQPLRKWQVESPVQLTAGVYFLERMEVEGEGGLIPQGYPVVVVAQEVLIRGNAGVGNFPNQLFLFARSVTVEGNACVAGNIYAERVELRENGTFQGIIRARTLQAGGNARLIYPQYFQYLRDNRTKPQMSPQVIQVDFTKVYMPLPPNLAPETITEEVNRLGIQELKFYDVIRGTLLFTGVVSDPATYKRARRAGFYLGNPIFVQSTRESGYNYLPQLDIWFFGFPTREEIERFLGDFRELGVSHFEPAPTTPLDSPEALYRSGTIYTSATNLVSLLQIASILSRDSRVVEANPVYIVFLEEHSTQDLVAITPSDNNFWLQWNLYDFPQ